jgi:hypothetical protein
VRDISLLAAHMPGTTKEIPKERKKKWRETGMLECGLLAPWDNNEQRALGFWARRKEFLILKRRAKISNK